MYWEIRWFFKGLIPHNVNSWFKDKLHGELPVAEERTDHYLYSPGCERLGIKLRQGRLEIKWRKVASSFVGCNGTVVGKVENWIKWRWDDSAAGENINSFIEKNPSEPWISVAKKRWQRWYNVHPQGSLEPVSKQKHKSTDCAIELTKLNVKGKEWWTLGLDVYAKADTVIGILTRCLDFLLLDYEGPKLESINSYSYPDWLNIISD